MQKKQNKHKRLTKKQKELYDYLLGYQKENHISPLYEEIKRDLVIKHPSVITRRLERLEDFGLIRKSKYKSRGIIVL